MVAMRNSPLLDHLLSTKCLRYPLTGWARAVRATPLIATAPTFLTHDSSLRALCFRDLCRRIEVWAVSHKRGLLLRRVPMKHNVPHPKRNAHHDAGLAFSQSFSVSRRCSRWGLLQPHAQVPAPRRSRPPRSRSIPSWKRRPALALHFPRVNLRGSITNNDERSRPDR
jgi:hypothetical protein